MKQLIDVACIEITDLFGAKQDIMIHHVTRVQSPTEGEKAMGWGCKLWMTGNPACSVQCKETREQIREMMGLVSLDPDEDPEQLIGETNGLAIQSVWRHEQRKTRYGLLGYARVQAAEPVGEGDEVAVYLSLDGMAADGQTLWVRPSDEFMDGRFIKEGN